MLRQAKEALQVAQAKVVEAASNVQPLTHTKGLQIRTALNEFRDTKARQHQGRLEEIDKAISALQEKRAMVTGAMQEVEASFTSRIKELDALMASLPKEDGPAPTLSPAESLANTLADRKTACL